MLYCDRMRSEQITRACKVVGGRRALAGILAVTPSAISQWETGKRPIPAERCPTIERATAGAVTCEDLRPDVDWGYLRATRCEQKEAA